MQVRQLQQEIVFTEMIAERNKIILEQNSRIQELEATISRLQAPPPAPPGVEFKEALNGQ